MQRMFFLSTSQWTHRFMCRLQTFGQLLNGHRVHWSGNDFLPMQTEDKYAILEVLKSSCFFSAGRVWYPFEFKIQIPCTECNFYIIFRSWYAFSYVKIICLEILLQLLFLAHFSCFEKIGLCNIHNAFLPYKPLIGWSSLYET